MEITPVQVLGLSGEHPLLDTHARRLEGGNAGTGDTRVRIAHGDDDALHAGRDEGLGTGRGPPMMTTGFEGHIGRGATGPFTGRGECHDLGMGATGTRVPALTDDLAVLHEDTANGRVRRRRRQSTTGQTQGARHPEGVVSLCRHRRS